MAKRWIAALLATLACTSAGCEITASAYLQHDLNSNPLVLDKPDGLVKAEIEITKLVGKDGKK